MQRSRVSHHPCHRLSVPSAKRFWCRHCMMVFEDAITRWRHSRSCRSGSFDNHVRRREIETQSLQKMAETLDPEMVTQITVPREDGSSKDLCCFICRQRFVSLDEMREHVKYPCNKPSSMQRAPIPLIFPEPTFGTGIQQHYTDAPVLQSYSRAQQGTSSASTSNPQAVTVYMNEGEQGDSEAKPTNIYVNENGETVIEVENLDLNTKSGELSLAHLLTQLSQQGIVFDQQPQGGETEVITSAQEPQVVQEPLPEVDYGPPTAVDAANTLTQLAGSAFRSANNTQEMYAHAPPVKRIKTEQVELQYQLEQPSSHHHHHQQHPQVQTFLPKEEPYEDNAGEKYIICTNESDMIRVMQANNMAPADSASGSRIIIQNGNGGPSGQQNALQEQQQHMLAEGEAEEAAVLCGGQADPSSQTTATLQAEESAAPSTATATAALAETHLAGQQMILVQHGQAQLVTHPTGQIIKSEQDPSEGHHHVLVEEQQQHHQQSHAVVEAVTSYVAAGGQEGVLGMMEPVDVGGQVGVVAQEEEGDKHCLVVPAANGEEVSPHAAALASDSAVTGLLEMSAVAATIAARNRDSQQQVLGAAEPQQVLVTEPQQALVSEPQQALVPQQALDSEPQHVLVSELQQALVSEPQQVLVSEPQQVLVPEPQQVLGPKSECQPQQVLVSKTQHGVITEHQQVLVSESQPQQVLVSEPQQVLVSEPQQVLVSESQPQQVLVSEPQQVLVSEPQQVLVSEPQQVLVSEPQQVLVSESESEPRQVLVQEGESAMLLPQIVSVSSAAVSSDVPQLVLQHHPSSSE